MLHFQVLLTVVIVMLLKVHTYNLATIAVLERGRHPLYATVCSIEIGGDQTLSCWDSPDSPVFKHQAGSWVGVVAGGTFMCGLQFPNRNAVCWTFTSDVQFSVPEEFKSITYQDLAAGENHVCGIRSDGGYLDCWNREGTVDHVQKNLTNFRFVTAGGGWTCVLMTPPSGRLPGANYIAPEKIVCGNGRNQETLSVLDWVTHDRISVGETQLCALYHMTIPVQIPANNIICWTLGTRTYSIIADSVYSYEGLVSGPDYTCSLDNGYLQCWGLGSPQLDGFQNVRFSEGGIAANGRTVCGVGLNDHFALRAICHRTGGYAIPQPFRFFLPEFCSRDCDTFSHFSSDSTSPQVAFDQATHAIRTNFCSDPAYSLCLPCYNRPCKSRCSANSSANYLVHCASRSKLSCRAAQVAASVLGGVLALISILFFLWALRESFLFPEKEGGRRGLFTKLRSVEHFCQNQAMFNINLIEFSYKDLELATNGFDTTNLLGQGSSGCVFKGVLLDKRQVAVKKLTNNGVNNQSDIYSHFDGELKLLARLRHENLVNLIGYCHQRIAGNICCWSWPQLKPYARIEYRLLVFEYMPNGTLHSHLHHKRDQLERPLLDWDMRLRIAVQAAKGIYYLHFGTEPPIIHRDIKSSNILLDERWNARLSDLGISRLGPLGNRTHISTLPAGTLGYLDPEYYRTQHLTLKSDVYSFGVVLLEVITGCKAIEGHLDPANIVERCVPIIQAGQAQTILDPKIPLTSYYLDRLLLVADIAESCVRMVRQERPSIAEVLHRLEFAAAAVATTPKLDRTPVIPTAVD